MGVARSSLLSRRQLPRLLGAGAVLFLLAAYYRCSSYVCPPRSSVRFDGGNGYPRQSLNSAGRSGQGHGSHGSSSTHTECPQKAAIVASMKGDDVSWLYEYFPDWQANVFVMDDSNAELTVARNKGRESMAYLTYIIDNYDFLPEYMVFLHSLRYQWHNEDPMYDGVPPLRNLRLPHVEKEGYATMRCTWALGCPGEIKPRKAITQIEAAFEPKNDRANTEAAYAHAFLELFPDKAVPEQVGNHCGAQFALAKWKVLERPKKDYLRYRDWLWKTPLEDSISGRILEYSWHIMFGKPAVNCPEAEYCFCNKFGLCNLTCLEQSCERRYQLPKFATIPTMWPEVGPGQDGFPEQGWWLK